MTTPLRAVLFDYGHTLIMYERPDGAMRVAYEQVRRRLNEALEREVPSAAELVQGVSLAVDAEIARDYEEGRLEEVEIAGLYDACLRQLGLELDPTLIEEVMEIEQRAWLEGIRPGPDVVPTLQRVRSAGLRIGLVSNAAYRPHLMRAQLQHLGLVSYFDSLTWSSEVGVRKPHPAIYTDALNKLGVPAPAALFVGDRVKEDILGPQALGMRAVLLREWRQEEDPEGAADFAIGRLSELGPLVDALILDANASYN